MPRTITVTSADGDLFRVSATQYDDSSCWLAIATANGMTNADIVGLLRLTIPDYDPSMVGSAAG